MKLLPKYISKKIPALYSQEHNKDPVVHAKIFDPLSNWTWFVIEFDGHDQCFGLVNGLDLEWGYFTLSELERVRNRWGIKLERDMHFSPEPTSKIIEKLT